MLWLALFGCAPDSQDSWTAASQVCSLQEDPWREPVPELAAECRARLLSDFGVDEQAFDEEDRLEPVIGALWSLAAVRQGPRSNAQRSGFVSPSMLLLLDNQAARIDQPDPLVQQLFYNHAALVVEQLAPSDEAESGFVARYVRATRTVLLAPEALQLPPESIAGIVAHEVAHATAATHVPCADNPDFIACDRDLHGAYGTAAGWFALAVPGLLDEPGAADRVETKAWESLERVNP